MDRYSRMLLHFLHAITNDRHRVHTLVFGTRLTNITRALRHRDVDVALARVAAAVDDWAGGTRIGACLAEFNRRWSRRLLGQNAVVLLISDGLDADAGEGLGVRDRAAREVVRRGSCGSIRCCATPASRRGRRASARMLPYVDDFLPVHNLASLRELAAALSRPPVARRASRSSASPA